MNIHEASSKRKLQKELIEKDLGVLKESLNYQALLMKKVEPFLGKSILEVGSGIGTYTEQFANLGSINTVVALEQEADFCDFLRSKQNRHISVCCLSVEDFIKSSKHINHNWNTDTVVMMNVLEHIKDDEEILRELSRALPAKGRIILITPARQFLFSVLDENYGHYRRYDKRTISNLARKLDLNIVENSYFNTLGFFGWLMGAKLLRAKQINPLGMKLIDSLLPLQDRLEGCFQRLPFGLSLLSVLEKQSDTP